MGEKVSATIHFNAFVLAALLILHAGKAQIPLCVCEIFLTLTSQL
jgi:hypothetical protein